MHDGSPKINNSGTPECTSVEGEYILSGDEKRSLEWRTGEVFLGTYKVIGFLGEGGMGKVFRVRHLGWNRDMAVKVLKPELAQRPRANDFFLRECETWVRLALHPHIVSCYYVRIIDGVPRIFAEYVDGGSLRSWITSCRLYKSGHRVSLKRILTIGIQSAWGLSHAHQNGLVHRDVKSGNILISSTSGAKVTDFGLAGALYSPPECDDVTTHSNLVSAGSMTPAYCSPEQFRREKVSLKTDIWSWALCLLEMMMGGVMWDLGPTAPQALETCFRRGAPFAYCPPMPQQLRELLQWCCSQDPADRPENMLEIVDILKTLYSTTFGEPYPHQPPKALKMHVDSLNNRAASLLDLGKLNEAVSLWKKVVVTEPGHIEATYNLGLLKWRAGRVTDEEFIAELDQAERLHPASNSLLLKSYVHLERGDYLSAEDSLKRTAVINADQAVKELLTAIETMRPKARRLRNTCKGHRDRVLTVNCAPTRGIAVSGSEDNTLRFWDIVTGKETSILSGHEGSIYVCAFDEQELCVVSGGADRTVRLWDVTTGKCSATVRTNMGPIAGLWWLQGSNRILVCDREGGIIYIAFPGGVTRNSKLEIRTEVLCSAFVSNKALLLVGRADGCISVWDCLEGKLVTTLDIRPAGLNAIAVASYSERIIAGFDDGYIVLGDVRDFRWSDTLRAHVGPVTCLSTIEESPLFVSGGIDGAVRLWDMDQKRCLFTFRGHVGAVRAVVLCSNLGVIISAGDDHSVYLWELGDVSATYRAPFALCRAVTVEAAVEKESIFSNLMAEASNYLRYENWGMAAKSIKRAREIPGFQRNEHAMDYWSRLYTKLQRTHLQGVWERATFRAYERNMIRKVSAPLWDGGLYFSGDNSIMRWGIDSKQAKPLSVFNGMSIKLFEFDSCEERGVVVSTDGTVMCWDKRNGRLLTFPETPTGNIEAISPSPDGCFLAVGGWELGLWDLSAGIKMARLGSQPSAISALTWSPDCNFLFAGTAEGELEVWNLVRGGGADVFGFEHGCITSLRSTSDGKSVFMGFSPVWGNKGKIIQWRVSDGSIILELDAHRGIVTDIALSIDGNYLVSCGSDNCVYLWDVRKGARLLTLSNRMMKPLSVTFSPECRMVAAVAEGGPIKVWELDWELQMETSSFEEDDIYVFIRSFLLNKRMKNEKVVGEKGAFDIQRHFARKTRPTWTTGDLKRLQLFLGYAGKGWIQHEDLEAIIQKTFRKQFGNIWSVFT